MSVCVFTLFTTVIAFVKSQFKYSKYIKKTCHSIELSVTVTQKESANTHLVCSTRRSRGL